MKTLEQQLTRKALLALAGKIIYARGEEYAAIGSHSGGIKEHSTRVIFPPLRATWECTGGPCSESYKNGQARNRDWRARRIQLKPNLSQNHNRILR